MARTPKITIACGRRATGKSIETIEMIYNYVKGNPLKDIPGRKALIFDVNDEFGTFTYKDGKLHKIKAMQIQDIPKFTSQITPEVRRIRPYWDNGKRLTIDDMSTVLGIILDHYRDGLLLVEDINKYTSDNMKRDLIGSLATIRQAGVDLIAHFQLAGKAGNPKILGMTNYIRLHKTFDSVYPHRKKFGDKAEIMQIAEKIVNARYKWGQENNINTEYGKYFSLYVDMENTKILGAFSKAEAKSAISEYLNDDYYILGRALKKMNTDGTKKYKDRSVALAELGNDLMKGYFVFDKK